MIIPVLLIVLLLAGVAALLTLAFLSPRFVYLTAVAVTGFCLLLWLILGWQLPASTTVMAWPVAGQSLVWRWQVTDTAWSLSGALLLLLLAAILTTGGEGRRKKEEEGRRKKEEEPASAAFPEERRSLLPSALCPLPSAAGWLLLVVATLTIIWSDSLLGMVMGWMLLIVAWMGTMWPVASAHHDFPLLWSRAGWLLLGLFLLWAVAVWAPDAAGWQVDAWPGIVHAAAWLAVAVQMGIWPLAGWRPFSWNIPAGTAALAHAAPTLAGATLLARLVAGSGVPLALALLLTAWAMFNLLRSIRLVWERLHLRHHALGYAALAHTSIILLAGVWAGEVAALAEARVLLLAVGVLFLATIPSWWSRLASWAAVAALAGLPLTAGFVGRASLYTAWLSYDRWLLLLVAVILHVLFLACLWWLVWDGEWQTPLFHTDTAGQRLSEAAVLLPALALITVSGVAWRAVPLAVWLVLAATAVLGLWLPRLLGEVRLAQVILRQALAIRLPRRRAAHLFRSFGGGAGHAFRQAAAILEGEGGLLWLLAAAILFLILTAQ